MESVVAQRVGVRCIAWLGAGVVSRLALTRGQQRKYDGYNEQRRNVADQMPMTVWGKCLPRHDAAVNHARPHSKPNEATVCEWIARGENEEHTERGINADDHERVVRVARVPCPTRRPSDHQRIKAENKNDADEDEGDA